MYLYIDEFLIREKERENQREREFLNLQNAPIAID